MLKMKPPAEKREPVRDQIDFTAPVKSKGVLMSFVTGRPMAIPDRDMVSPLKSVCLSIYYVNESVGKILFFW